METNWCILVITPDEMSALLALKLPEGDDVSPIGADYIENFIKSQGINSGINKDAISALSEQLVYGQYLEVAKGKPAVNGSDGYFDFVIQTEDVKSKPVINSDGSVDYLNSLNIAEVSENQLFARYVHATNGEYGHNIYSHVVAPIPGKELPPLKGKGFYSDEKKEEYFASYSGHIIRKDNSVTIDKIYIVSGDLEIEHGNVHFDGDVEIRGDVRSGLTIESGGSVYINGHVGACVITAKENITISKGVQGHSRGILTAGNDITCKFIEHCTINAAGNVYADSILDAIVVARKEVKVVSKTGQIIGGTVVGMAGITAKECGSDSETPTSLYSGPSKEDIVKSINLSEQLYKLSNDIELLNKQLEKYDALPTQNEETKGLRQKVFRVKIMVTANKNKIQEELNEINAHINNARKGAKVHITGISHPGTKIIIENNVYNVTESFKDVVYKLFLGKIEAMGSDDESLNES